jgi:predicted acyltransferase
MDPQKRWSALDAFRGLAVFLMLPVNAAMDFESIPAWFKHAPGEGLTMPDFIMPAFLLSLGISSTFSLARRRAETGTRRTLLHGLLRYALLFAFGSIGYLAVWKSANWEVLQMLGLSGALAFPFLFLKPLPRSLAAALILLAVEILRPGLFGPAFQAWYASGIGGPLGAIPLAAIPIASSALGELLKDRSWPRRAITAGLAGLALLAGGLVATLALGAINKHLLSLSYLLVTAGSALIALAGLEGLVAALGARDLPLLGPLGRNPLLAYMAGGILTLGMRAFLPASLAPALAWLASLALLGLMTGLAILLDRKRLYLRL